MKTEALLDRVQSHLLRMSPHARDSPEFVLFHECSISLIRLIEDERRLDWLADKDNDIGQILLPRECVEANLTSMRRAIDAAMALKRFPA